jgi:hypothetical protein
MKQIILSSCTLGLVLSLSACGGGGGGGSSGISSGSSLGATTFTFNGMAGDATRQSTPALTTADQTAKALADTTNTNMQNNLKLGHSMVGGTVLKVESNGSVTLMQGGLSIATFNSGDMRFYNKEHVDFVAMMDTPRASDVNEPDYKASTRTQNAAWIGKLEYASFGYWVLVRDIQGTIGGTPTKGTKLISYDYFYDGRRSEYRNTNLSFTGIASGVAEYRAVNSAGAATVGTIPLLGTASLNLTYISSIHDGTLELIFPDFYRLTGKVSAVRDGKLTGSFTDWQKLGSASPVDLPSTPGQLSDNKIQGQLYGVSASSPTEAAGMWLLNYDADTKYIHVGGVFGVKKK